MSKRSQLPAKAKTLINRAALLTGTAIAAVSVAHADTTFDVTSATGALAGVTVAVAAMGAVKIVPAAAAWGWSMLTRTASRN